MEDCPLTTDEWVAVNALGLAAEVACHIKNLTDLNEEDRAVLLRMIMISIRNWKEDKNEKSTSR
jgi:hypothetical protein